jgi:hypothetical protein
VTELLDLYTQDELDHLLTKHTLDYIKEYSKPQTVTVGSIEEELTKGHEVYVDSPDGFVRVEDFVDKGRHEEYTVVYDNTTLRVNGGHRLQTTMGWEHVYALYDDHERGRNIHVLHSSGGYKEVNINRTGQEIPIVDIMIDHENHRYYSDGLCSHNTNVGKSAMLCFIAGELMKAGHDVLYITMEMAEELVHERVDANLLDIATDDLKHTDKKTFMSKVNKMKQKTHGRLYVKEYPTSSAHAGHFRHLMKELKQKKKFKAKVVLIDYINICASSRYKSLSGVNSYSYIKAIAEELRGLAVEFDVPILTATQTNRAGANDDKPDMTATSECLTLDTEVITNKGKKTIAEVRVGERLLGSDGFVTVSQVHHPKKKKVYEITTKSGKKIRCSADHVFPTSTGRSSINTGLSIGDLLNSIDL